MYPVEFGPDFDWALEVLLFRFFTTLEGRTPVPDFRKVGNPVNNMITRCDVVVPRVFGLKGTGFGLLMVSVQGSLRPTWSSMTCI